MSLGENCPSLVLVSGAVEIKKINATNTGHLVVLKFASTPTANVQNFTATADDTLTSVCDGSSWVLFPAK
ncbi:MAG: hypothetical protein JWO81_2560 [Alphaproteobacteria bacterium]|nr:hypothetical protein [Alphaproteobacteria bacterium]